MNNKTKEIRQMFMKESSLDMWEYYENCLLNHDFKTWDWIVLTASNEQQAKIYENEIQYRLNHNLIPQNIQYLVLPDPDGKRVGSGGATLNVLSEIRKRDNRNFDNLKILTIHSGGDSKRVPQYSVCGKLFSPVQRELPNGKSSSLFDEFMITFSSVASRMASGMMLLSGDVMLCFNPMQVDFFNLDSAAISIKENVKIGKEHGVFLSDKTGQLLEFLHKLPVDELRKKGAVNNNDNVDIDTGAIYLCSKICNDLFSLISDENTVIKEKFDKYINDVVRLSLYGDFLYPLAKNVIFEEYLMQAAEGTLNEELKSTRKILWEKLSKYEMKVIKTSPSEFIHFGTTAELKELVTEKIDNYNFLNWKRRILTNDIPHASFSSNCSYVNINTKIGERCYIEKSYIGENCNIGDDVILSNVRIDNIDVPNGICLNTLKQLDGTFVTRIYSINENPKVRKETGSTFLANNFIEILDYYNIKDEVLWDSNEKDIWNAKFYCKCNTEKESVERAIKLYNIFNKNLSIEEVDNYFKIDRISMKDSFNNCDAKYMKYSCENIEIHIRALNYLNMIKSRKNLIDASDVLLKSPDLDTQIKKIVELLNKEEHYVKYRVYLSLSLILKHEKTDKFNSLHYENLCYDEIRKSISTLNIEKNMNFKVKDEVKVELPIRVNFGGGWSDTPPFCIENGGSVLNGAFKLNGINPIRVIIKKQIEPKITLRSIDLGVEKDFNNIDDLKDCYNTNDAFSLLKASLIITGIIKKEDNDIKDVINRIGSGFEFETDVTSIPKGSGLGTSSILSAACLKALYKFLGIDITYEKLASKVLEQEQLMSTGGGWQDQIGGLVPGIKLITTEKGLVQEFNIETLELSDDVKNMFNERFALIYTGQRRLAKNLLRNVMNNYIIGNDVVVDTINKIKDIAIQMSMSLKNSNIKDFANLLNQHFELSKKLDKGCTNSCIDQIINSCEDLVEARMICGAGGGGFLQVLLKENVTKKQLKERINEIFQDSGVAVYDISLMEEEE